MFQVYFLKWRRHCPRLQPCQSFINSHSFRQSILQTFYSWQILLVQSSVLTIFSWQVPHKTWLVSISKCCHNELYDIQSQMNVASLVISSLDNTCSTTKSCFLLLEHVGMISKLLSHTSSSTWHIDHQADIPWGLHLLFDT